MTNAEMIIKSIEIMDSMTIESLQKARTAQGISDNLIKAIDLMIERKQER